MSPKEREGAGWGRKEIWGIRSLFQGTVGAVAGKQDTSGLTAWQQEQTGRLEDGSILWWALNTWKCTSKKWQWSLCQIFFFILWQLIQAFHNQAVPLATSDFFLKDIIWRKNKYLHLLITLTQSPNTKTSNRVNRGWPGNPPCSLATMSFPCLDLLPPLTRMPGSKSYYELIRLLSQHLDLSLQTSVYAHPPVCLAESEQDSPKYFPSCV